MQTPPLFPHAGPLEADKLEMYLTLEAQAGIYLKPNVNLRTGFLSLVGGRNEDAMTEKQKWNLRVMTGW